MRSSIHKVFIIKDIVGMNIRIRLGEGGLALRMVPKMWARGRGQGQIPDHSADPFDPIRNMKLRRRFYLISDKLLLLLHGPAESPATSSGDVSWRVALVGEPRVLVGARRGEVGGGGGGGHPGGRSDEVRGRGGAAQVDRVHVSLGRGQI